MAETALAFALKKAGVNTDAALLRRVAEDELRKAALDVKRALSPFTEEVRDAGGIMAELVPYAATRDLAFGYLERVAADMRGEGLKVPAKAGDGVRFSSESQKKNGPVENSEGVTVHHSSDGSRFRSGLSPSDTVPAQAGGGVQPAYDSRSMLGSPESSERDRSTPKVDDSRFSIGPSRSDPVRDGAVRLADEGHGMRGRVVPIPNKPRGLDAMKTHAKINSVYDSYLTRDGIPIGDVVWSALPRIESANAREAALLRLIREHVSPVGNPNARVRDLIKVEDLQRMIQKAAEIAQ